MTEFSKRLRNRAKQAFLFEPRTPLHETIGNLLEAIADDFDESFDADAFHPRRSASAVIFTEPDEVPGSCGDLSNTTPADQGIQQAPKEFKYTLTTSGILRAYAAGLISLKKAESLLRMREEV